MRVYRPRRPRPASTALVALLIAWTSASGCANESPVAAGSGREAVAEENDAAAPAGGPAPAAGDATAEPADAPAKVSPGPTRATPRPLPPPEGAKRLSPDHTIWIDKARGLVIIDGNISLRRGPLEMFACVRNSKEHESVVSANTRAYAAHAALLALGARPGAPVQFDPQFRPPRGPEIEITLRWRDRDGQMRSARAQDWVRDMRTGAAMELPFVFAGSWLVEDEQTGEKAYAADMDGDFICVSNFSTAMLDVPAPSTASQDGLFFEAFTERVPPLGTPVRMELKPRLADAAGPPAQQRAASDPS